MHSRAMYYPAYSLRRPGCGIVWMHVGAMRPEAPGCKLVLIRVLMLRITRAPHHAVFPGSLTCSLQSSVVPLEIVVRVRI